MFEPGATPAAKGAAPEATPRDPALLMRRAIRAVAAAESTVARCLADAARRDIDAARRQATYATFQPGRTRRDQAVVDRQYAEARTECEGTLRVAVDQYVGLLRTVGKPPERALVHLKGVFRDTAIAELERRDRARLMERVVRWGIEAYYRDAAAGERCATSTSARD